MSSFDLSINRFKVILRTCVRTCCGIALNWPSRHPSRRPPGSDLGHPADAASHRGSHPGLHGRGGDQQRAVGLHTARLDRHLLQQLPGDPACIRTHVDTTFNPLFPHVEDEWSLWSLPLGLPPGTRFTFPPFPVHLSSILPVQSSYLFCSQVSVLLRASPVRGVKITVVCFGRWPLWWVDLLWTRSVQISDVVTWVCFRFYCKLTWEGIHIVTAVVCFLFFFLSRRVQQHSKPTGAASFKPL